MNVMHGFGEMVDMSNTSSKWKIDDGSKAVLHAHQEVNFRGDQGDEGVVLWQSLSLKC